MPAEHCQHCQKALRSIRSVRTVLLGAAAATFLGIALVLGRGGAVLQPASLALVAGLAACLAAFKALQRLEQQFMFTDWRHSEHR